MRRVAVVAWVLSGCSGAKGPPASRAAPPALGADHRQCSTDTDCVVVPTIAGLDHLPGPGESCRAVCYLGVNRSAEAAWRAEVKARSAAVPCAMELEPCPVPEDFEAYCHARTCAVRYAPKP